jgi:hypothetical protein
MLMTIKVYYWALMDVLHERSLERKLRLQLAPYRGAMQAAVKRDQEMEAKLTAAGY